MYADRLVVCLGDVVVGSVIASAVVVHCLLVCLFVCLLVCWFVSECMSSAPGGNIIGRRPYKTGGPDKEACEE